MANPIRLGSGAWDDYLDALSYYVKAGGTKLAKRFDVIFNAALAKIETDPERFPPLDARYRYCILPTFPFRVIFRISKTPKRTIEVIAVAHHRRRPSHWRRRDA